VWAIENGLNWSVLFSTVAAKNGHLEVLKWAKENGWDWNYKALCDNAAELCIRIAGQNTGN